MVATTATGMTRRQIRLCGAQSLVAVRKPNRLRWASLFQVPVILVSEKAFKQLHGKTPMRKKTVTESKTGMTTKITEAVACATTDEEGLPWIVCRKSFWRNASADQRQAMLYHEREHIFLGHPQLRFFGNLRGKVTDKTLEEHVETFLPRWVKTVMKEHRDGGTRHFLRGDD